MSSKKNQKRTKTAAPAPRKSPPLALWIGIGVLALALIAGVVLISNPSAPVANAANTSGVVSALPAEVSVAEAAAKRDAGAFILDVREPYEWVETHIPGATLIPLGELASRVAEVPKDKQVVVVCRSGNRSQSGRDILQRAGFTNVTSMTGGVNQWRSAGLPTVAGQ